ncbi:M56 family metallopeptidase [Mucilaginibacter lacusdianchii]|uniref:M56 family metallopeptidase n=1 Tax=Mucilaginibacter lacusdianchii TaxID=2684211 RepID=UPI00131EA3AF|nr:M56 family metallopeptidase [Mucilaginibacter sp. JXJ CY 39]
MTWWHYLLLSNLYLILFFGFYALLLRRETFFQLNRIYLVGSALLSFGIPLVQLDRVKQWLITQQVRETIYQASPQFIYAITPGQGNQHITLGQVMLFIYIAGIIVLTCKLLWQLLALRRFIQSGDGAWSFFKKIKVDEALAQHNVIMAHEQVHARQWHSADVLLIEAVMIVNWFNPIVYLYRGAIKNIHEYIADRDALKDGASKAEYAMLLLSQTFNAPVHGLLNPFFNKSMLKQRILMLQKSRSNRMALVKYGFSAPLFALMVILSSATISNSGVVKDIHQKAEQVFELPANASLLPAEDIVNTAPASIIQRSWPSVLTSGHIPKRNIKQPAESLINKKSLSVNKSGNIEDQHNEVFTSAEHTPEFPGGIEKFYQFLGQQIRYPKTARDNNIQGRVIVTFVVEKDGSLSDVHSLRGPGSGLEEEAVRVIARSPSWIPGVQNGNKVRVQYTVPVLFTMANDDVPKPDTTIKKIRFATKQITFKNDQTENENTGHLNELEKNNSAKFNINPSPLVIIDGKEMPSGIELQKLEPSKIKSISVLKDKTATALYGAKGEKGVILVITNKQ